MTTQFGGDTSATSPLVQEHDRLWRRASALALFTIFYNVVEGVVSVWLGAGDETLALFGFGLDSFVEVISGIGVWHMVRRLRVDPGGGRDAFERQALRTTGWAFYLLAAGLALTSVVDLISGHRPETTFYGIVVSVVSIIAMWALIRAKVSVGTALDSPAILADAACTRTCLNLSFVLLVASLGFEATGIAGLDAAGTLGIAWLSWREGKESFGKAQGLTCCCSGTCRGA